MTDGITQVQAQVGGPARLSAIGAPVVGMCALRPASVPRYTTPCWQLATDDRRTRKLAPIPAVVANFTIPGDSDLAMR